MRFFSTAFICLSVLFGVNMFNSAAHAQTNMSLQQDASLQVTPRYPEPGQTVSVQLNDYAFNSNGATIRWYVDDIEIEEAANLRQINLTTKAAGQTTTVRSVSSLGSGQAVQAQTTITPVQLDMLVEANTLTPSFYPGRALPTPGSQVRVTAIPFAAETTDPQNYSYTWEVGEDVIDGGSVRGKNFAIFRSNFERVVQTTVTVYNPDGSILTKKTTNIPIVKPQLLFYEVNPLRGVLPLALNGDSIFTGEEITVRAEPFHYDLTSLSGNTQIEWALNNRSVENNSNDPFEITLQHKSGSGSFSLGFHIRNLAQLLQGVKDDVKIQF